MDVVGGVADAELLDDQVDVVAGLPGVLAMTEGPLPNVFGTAAFLRAWAAQPGFRLLKQSTARPRSGQCQRPVP
ncbi:DUF6368 family protein [Kitasatospora sp. NPDC017646]|uniref:DUF6368 family protein n=1 Tax=Kitasatospora sp. NPDC017646 TaxID=3364024 RepID=UPI0037B960E8